MICNAQHAKYDVPIEEFICPKCGATPDTNPQFCIAESDPAAHSDCERLHHQDELYCNGCGYHAYGKEFSKKIAANQNLVACPHCRGKGLVKGEPS